MLAAARIATRSGQSPGAPSSGPASSRYAASTAPTFGTVVTNAATGVLAPSVTSGTQKWAGTAPSLNASPASTASPPTATATRGAPGRASASWTVGIGG